MASIRTDILNQFPSIDEAAADILLQKEIASDPCKIIVLDDDPTGVQTVHGISVYTDWEEESIRQGLGEQNKLFYILTNSRGFTASQTREVHTQIARRIHRVSAEMGLDVIVISRSDSTLRGHYPLETEVLKEVFEEESGRTIDGEILCPFFKEGGRFTLNNIHYVQYGDELVPAGETEFAGDKTFGYHSSGLPAYVEEKTGGRFPASEVTCISLDLLRSMDYDGITRLLLDVTGFRKVIVNAIDYCDIKVFCTALYRAMAAGKRYLFRTAAAIVKVLGGITDKPLLTRQDMVTRDTSKGGIIVVGSHTAKTTAQLNELLTLSGLLGIEFRSDLVLASPEQWQDEISRVQELCEEAVDAGKTAVVYTNRKLLTIDHDTKEEALLRSVRISDAVQSFVGNLKTAPAFVIAKGGITSSDVGTKALRVKRATVMGQIRPGIPVWQTGEESLFPHTPYVIFPGNVGEVTTLREAAQILMGQ
ncbi:four-carbon acid sugar kinase family protein [Anaerolentibacter hominis]|uniref:four-carbon acid sugar kinase family protein n=1 Tax=Anaerolentibacter hominis TaxID=3079009 RepID=UPI0031B88B43